MENSVEALSKYRFESAEEALEDSKLMFANGRFKNALNRAYYAVFHAMRAVNALDKYDSSKHSGVIAYFNQNYVKTGVFPKEASKLIRLTAENREKADYLDFFVASKKEAEKQIGRAETFLCLIEEYLKNKKIIIR